MKENARQGFWNGARAPIGYRVIAAGERTKLSGVNIVGLKRHGFSPEVISELKTAYRIFFRSGLTVKRAVQTIEEEGLESAEVQYLSNFILNSERGVLRK